MPRHGEGGAARSARSAQMVRRWWRALASEACATALLVWLGVGAALAPGAGLGAVAFAFGGAVTGCCLAFGPASGAHMNPALSLAAALAGRLPWAAAAAYALAQLVGATLGFAALLGTLPAARGAPPAGLTAPGAGVAPGAAAALEAALAGLLALACCALWAAPRPDPAAPVQLGLLVVGLVYAGGATSGASLNPARSFAPALLHWRWEHQWVYWVGPLGGAALASLLHRLLTPAAAERTQRKGERDAESGTEALRLDDKA